MPHDDKPFISTPTTLSAEQRIGHVAPQRHGPASNVQRYRATYTPLSAEKWRGVFDAMLDTRKDQIVSTAVTGLKPNTMYAAAQDALKWLADNIPVKDGETCNKYAALRPCVSITRLEDPLGIMIYFKHTLNNIIATASAAPPTVASISVSSVLVDKTFKDEFESWLSTAQPGDIFEKTTMLTVEQRKWLTDVLASLGEGVECDLSEGKVKVMR